MVFESSAHRQEIISLIASLLLSFEQSVISNESETALGIQASMKLKLVFVSDENRGKKLVQACRVIFELLGPSCANLGFLIGHGFFLVCRGVVQKDLFNGKIACNMIRWLIK